MYRISTDIYTYLRSRRTFIHGVSNSRSQGNKWNDLVIMRKREEIKSTNVWQLWASVAFTSIFDFCTWQQLHQNTDWRLTQLYFVFFVSLIIRDYFQLRIHTDLVLCCVFTAAGLMKEDVTQLDWSLLIKMNSLLDFGLFNGFAISRLSFDLLQCMSVWI